MNSFLALFYTAFYLQDIEKLKEVDFFFFFVELHNLLFPKCVSKERYGNTENVMCDVIKIRLKRKDERRSGKENPLKRNGFKRISMMSQTDIHFNKCLLSCLPPSPFLSS